VGRFAVVPVMKGARWRKARKPTPEREVEANENCSFKKFAIVIDLLIQQFSRSTIVSTARAITSRPAGDRTMTLFSLKRVMTSEFNELDEQVEGQGLVEYALLIFLVSIASAAALTALGVGVKTQLYDVIQATLPF
jgi:Flp pilus assembly pilin Flp